MKKMSRFQDSLASIRIHSFDSSGRKVPEPIRLLKDFPEVLEDSGFADSIYDRIYGKMDWEGVRTNQCRVNVGERDVNYKSDCIEVKLDLPAYFAYELIAEYGSHVPKDEKYSREETLEKAEDLLCEKLDYLYRYLQQVPLRGRLDSHNLVIAHRYGQLSLKEERESSNRDFKIKFPGGRRRDDSGRQAAMRIFNELTKILIPGFDKANKSVPKIRAAFDAVALAGLPDPDSRIADQLWGKRSPKQAAICLTAQKLNRSERQVRRWVSE